LYGHIKIADGSKINAQSGVSKSIKTPNSAVTGSPAFDYTAALRSQAVSRNLPELEKRIKELEKLVEQLLKEKWSDLTIPLYLLLLLIVWVIQPIAFPKTISMRLHTSLTAYLLILCALSSFSNPLQSTLTGEIIGRESKALLLFKPTDKIQDEKSRIRIPIKNNRFFYTLNVNQIEMYQLVFEDEFEKGSYKPILFFPYQGNIHFSLYSTDEFEKKPCRWRTAE
jgi:hypothetical protein